MKRKYTLAAVAAYALTFTAAVLTSCGDDASQDPYPDPDSNATKLIQACAARGGHALYTQSESGYYVYFLACEEPTP